MAPDSVAHFRPMISCRIHYENTPIQTHWTFYHQKWKISDKKSDILHISAHNIDYGYALEPPHRDGSNVYLPSTFLRSKKNNVCPCIAQFYYIKVRFKGGGGEGAGEGQNYIGMFSWWITGFLHCLFRRAVLEYELSFYAGRKDIEKKKKNICFE